MMRKEAEELASEPSRRNRPTTGVGRRRPGPDTSRALRCCSTMAAPHFCGQRYALRGGTAASASLRMLDAVALPVVGRSCAQRHGASRCAGHRRNKIAAMIEDTWNKLALPLLAQVAGGE